MNFLTLQIPLGLIQCLNSIENVTELGNCINTEMQPDYADPESEIGSKYVAGTKPGDLNPGRGIQQNSGTTECYKKNFTTLKAYINLFRGQVQCFELS
jgi:hypothetical protein